jgi:hypothetical protein
MLIQWNADRKQIEILDGNGVMALALNPVARDVGVISTLMDSLQKGELHDGDETLYAVIAIP